MQNQNHTKGNPGEEIPNWTHSTTHLLLVKVWWELITIEETGEREQEAVIRKRRAVQAWPRKTINDHHWNATHYVWLTSFVNVPGLSSAAESDWQVTTSECPWWMGWSWTNGDYKKDSQTRDSFLFSIKSSCASSLAMCFLRFSCVWTGILMPLRIRWAVFFSIIVGSGFRLGDGEKLAFLRRACSKKALLVALVCLSLHNRRRFTY